MVTACHVCGLVLEADRADADLACPRCHTVLYRHKDGMRNSLFFSLSAMLLMIPSVSFPFIEVQLNSFTISANLIQTAYVMVKDGYLLAGLLIFLTTFVFPLFYLALMIFVSGSCILNVNPPFLWASVRLLKKFQYFQMVDVFIVGILVSIVKLVDLAEVQLLSGFYTMSAMSISLVASGFFYDKRFFMCRSLYGD